MPILPKPYPDEIVGSIILRGRQRMALPWKPFLAWIYATDSGRRTCSFVLEPSLQRIALLCGTSPRELLYEHTVFPYVAAYLPRYEVERIETTLSAAERPMGVCTAALSQNVTQASPFRRYCACCAAEDKKRYGETYWHRVHQLPATLFCEKHDVPLIETGIRSTVSSRAEELSLPPVVPSPAFPPPSIERTKAFALLSHSRRALTDPQALRENWCERYREAARQAGYVRPSGQLATGMLGQAIQQFYGPDLLVHLRSSVVADKGHLAWPALLLRPGVKEPASVVRHILLEVFLEQARISKGEQLALHNRPRVSRDYAELDRLAAAQIQASIAKTASEGRRTTLFALLREAGISSAFRHDRSRFPLCQALFEVFKASDQAQRQRGGREYWRKRTPSRWGLPSKRGDKARD